MSPQQVSYWTDTVLGFILFGLFAASDQLLAQGYVDWRSVGLAVLGAVVAFGRKWVHSNLGSEQATSTITAAQQPPPASVVPPPSGPGIPPRI